MNQNQVTSGLINWNYISKDHQIVKKNFKVRNAIKNRRKYSKLFGNLLVSSCEFQGFLKYLAEKLRNLGKGNRMTPFKK